jgi:hypothetical protein
MTTKIPVGGAVLKCENGSGRRRRLVEIELAVDLHRQRGEGSEAGHSQRAIARMAALVPMRLKSGL